MSRKLRVRPSPGASFFGGLVGIVFVVIGFTLAIPGAGWFGVLWTLIALVGTITSFYNAFSEHGIASDIVEISEEDETDSHAFPLLGRRSLGDEKNTIEARLIRLTALKDKGLITHAEYAQQRAEILKEV